MQNCNRRLWLEPLIFIRVRYVRSREFVCHFPKSCVNCGTMCIKFWFHTVCCFLVILDLERLGGMLLFYCLLLIHYRVILWRRSKPVCDFKFWKCSFDHLRFKTLLPAMYQAIEWEFDLCDLISNCMLFSCDYRSGKIWKHASILLLAGY